MSPFPDFANPTLFPTFSSCPLADSSPDQSSTYLLSLPFLSYTIHPNPNTPPSPQFLLGTIAENMTLSTSPTFILKDRSSTSFALTLKLPKNEIQEGVRGGGYDVKGFKKGFTVVVKGARRSGVKEGKAGFVQVDVDRGLVKVCFQLW